ncbi:MAG: hypothetical protein RQ739_13840 [Desulfotignum sp.]|nr:hypothetical protein [Desulfotignum sp.]
MKSIHLYTTMVLALVFFWMTGSAGAWNSQRRHYDSPRSSHMYDNRSEYPGYGHSNPKYRQNRPYKKKDYRNTPSWKDYHRRLHHRFNGFSPKDYHRTINRYDNDHTFSHGWELIRKDRPEKALQIFRQLAGKTPYEGEAKIGVAIAAAQNRQMFDGVVAMRRTLKYDPDALNRVSVDDTLRREIHELTENYQSRFHGLSASDTHFMVASLYYLMNDLDRCVTALEKNYAAGDRAISTLNLYRLAGYEAYN